MRLCRLGSDAKVKEENPAEVLTRTLEGMDTTEMIEVLGQEMQKAAAALEFERAASLRDKIEELRLQIGTADRKPERNPS